MATDSTIELVAQNEVALRLQFVLPRLAALGVRRLEVFLYGRPGDPLYWVAFLLGEDGRYSLGTPDLRHLPQDVQADDLVRQLDFWTPRPRGDAELLGTSHEK